MKREMAMPKKSAWLRPLVRLPFLRDRRGVTALEFALSAPVALIMLFSVIEFGRAVFTQGMMLFAAEEATRWAIVNYDATTAEIEAIAASRIDLAGLKDNATISATNPLNADQTRTVSVTITYDFQLYMPIGKIDPIQLTASSQGFLSEE